jgi:hypothetical protein
MVSIFFFGTVTAKWCHCVGLNLEGPHCTGPNCLTSAIYHSKKNPAWNGKQASEHVRKLPITDSITFPSRSKTFALGYNPHHWGESFRRRASIQPLNGQDATRSRVADDPHIPLSGWGRSYRDSHAGYRPQGDGVHPLAEAANMGSGI